VSRTTTTGQTTSPERGLLSVTGLVICRSAETKGLTCTHQCELHSIYLKP
jgi:hypothetical protein